MHCDTPCPECPNRKRAAEDRTPIVSGSYPEDTAPVLFVGESPNIESSNRRRVLCGRPGEEFNATYLPLAGLCRSGVAITNTVKCHYSDSDDPPPALVKSCSEFHLRRELAHYRPRVVVLMGSVANSLLDLDVEFEHGMADRRVLLGHECTVFSTYHPSLGLHKPEAMLSMLDPVDGDYPRLGKLLRGKLPRLVDSCPQPEFARLRKGKHVRDIMRQYPYWHPVAVDTESKKRWKGWPATERYIPYCATWCNEEGYAWMVKVEDEDAMSVFLGELIRFSTILMHNSPHDQEVIRQMGMEIPWAKIRDTMQMAYNDGRVRKGLKPLAYRLLGHRMTSFEDVVVPASRSMALDYLVEAIGRTWPSPVQTPTGKMVTRNCPDCKGKGRLWNGVRGKHAKYYPCTCDGGKVTVEAMTRRQGITDKLNRLATDIANKGDGVDIWKRWVAWGESDPDGLQAVIDALGPIPLPSIEYVEESRQLIYAAGDAHDTWRIYWPLQERLVSIRRSIGD